MSKAKKADLLLCAARHWQQTRPIPCASCVCSTSKITDDLYDPHDTFESFPRPEDIVRRCLDSASAALSEVAALGFDVESVEP